MRLTPPRPQVELLLATSAPEHATLLQNAEEDTPLHMAALSGAVGAVGLLADARSVRAANVEGFTALHYAAGEGDVVEADLVAVARAVGVWMHGGTALSARGRGNC